MTDQGEQLASALAGRYTIKRELGAGGMATVYLAEDVKHHRKVAIKVLRPELAAMMGPDRFLREIEVAARLQHPHIVPLHDSGEAAGILFYVMPYVEGESLRDRLNRDSHLPVSEVVQVLRDVTDALVLAHGLGLVHRDIKPDNIMSLGRHALVTDFGVAKAMSEATGSQQLTTVGVALGTPAYMSPEQASAESHIDHRADLYAVGALAYELLTGRPPFVGPTSQMVLAAHVSEPPEPVTKHRPNVPPALAQLVMKCLEKRPADRWQSAEALLHRLDELAATTDGNTTAEPRSVFQRVRARSKHTIAGTVALLAIAGVSWWVSGFRSIGADETTRRFIAVLPFANISADTSQNYFSTGMTAEISLQLSKLSALRVLSQTALTRYQDSPDRLARMSGELGLGSAVGGTVRIAAGDVRVNVELVDAGTGEIFWSNGYQRKLENIFSIQSEVALDVASALQAELSADEERRIRKLPTDAFAAWDLYQQSQEYSYGRQPNEVAIELLRTAIRIDTAFALAYSALAGRYMRWVQDHGYPIAWADSGLAMARRSVSIDPDHAIGHNHIATNLAVQGRVLEAFETFSLVAALLPSRGPVLGDLSEMESWLGRFDRALQQARRARVLDPTYAWGRFQAASYLLALGEDDHAEREYRDALREFPENALVIAGLVKIDLLHDREESARDRAAANLAEDTEDFSNLLLAAETALLTSRWDEARAHYSRLYDRTTGASGASRVLVFPSAPSFTGRSVAAALGFTLLRTGNGSRGNTLLEDALTARQAQLAAGNEMHIVRAEIASIHAVREERSEALQWLGDAYDKGMREYRILQRDPMFENLRGVEEFDQLLADMETDIEKMRRDLLPAEDEEIPRRPSALDH